MSFSFTKKPKAPACPCPPPPPRGRLDLLIAQYEELVRETRATRDELIIKVRQLNDMALQGSNKNATNTAILNAIEALPQEASESEINSLF